MLGSGTPALLFKNYNKGYLNPTFKLQYKKKGHFSLGDNLWNNENKPTPSSPRVFFTMETGASSP